MIRQSPILMIVTDPGIPSLLERLADAISGGANLVQYRDKTATTDQRVRWIRSFKDRHPGSLLIVNDDIDAVIQADADGLHLSSRLHAAASNRPLGPGRILGRSLHAGSIDSDIGHETAADYVTMGTIYPSESHPDIPSAGLDGLRSGVEEAGVRLGPVPVLAIGGVNRDNAAECIRAGARGVAVVRGVLMDADPGQAASDILISMRNAI